MFRLDNNFLIELGLGALPADEKNKMLAHIYETLEMRVGMKLAEQMSDAQLNEFEAFIDRKDEAGALKWLETNFPNYKQVVADELEKLKSEIKQVAPQIVSGAQANSAAQPTVTPQNSPAYPSGPMPQQPYQQSQTAQDYPSGPNQMPYQAPAQTTLPSYGAPMPSQPPVPPQPQPAPYQPPNAPSTNNPYLNPTPQTMQPYQQPTQPPISDDQTQQAA